MSIKRITTAVIIASFLSLGVFQPSFIPLGQTTNVEASSLFRPLPFEDADLGRNSHAYLGKTQAPTEDEKEAFVNQMTEYGIQASKQYGMPASAIIGMAIIESGYGTTRTAHFANNLFGIKVWGFNPPNAWQLKGQPDEDFDRSIPVIANYGPDRIVFDETQRRDNWYRHFDSYEHSVQFLTGNLLVNQRYHFAIENYQDRIANGWNVEDASREYLYDIANAGYNHLGGDYYQEVVGKLMDQWDLYRHDVIEDVQKEEDTPTSGVYHTVVSGDTLWRLSLQYGTTVDAIQSANNLTSDMLFLGQVLFIPVNQPVSEPIDTEPPAPTEPEPIKEEPVVEPTTVVEEEPVEEPVVEKTRGNGNNNGGGNNGGGPKKR
ncbi:glucosaminidase domain and LysM peptidoglycan-binding domain-containing protein [Desertibacillus haloalkaliphilus]|uniref:glucosaminidase domain and LysM peptidoglycan-binding domain-containing protein n=1 Tax=Desertibacillus haloalkaliphilus TaxID=1328930 RepID=UPI001C256584|nr:LysM peptidoglycan-binding domain-containing protein [Desertibacillus haloalkaliphilus]MBU8908752.1 LysM peptidoglycan-binding domain-containing protein [Desertibacillus haloalkaliphilus]